MKKGEKRKLELMQIAYKMFISNGYENTSVDEIIEKAGIAKGTYYYYFESKEQTLEEVIGMMIEQEAENARQILDAPIPIPQKIVAIISAFQPAPEEHTIEGALMHPENIVMHEKVHRRLLDRVIPILTEVVDEGVREGIFACEDIPRRVRMLMVLSSDTFDEPGYTDRDIEVFIDMTEKLLGAGAGTMSFIRDLIGRGDE